MTAPVRALNTGAIATNADMFAVVSAGTAGSTQPININCPLLFAMFTNDASKGIITVFLRKSQSYHYSTRKSQMVRRQYGY